MSSSRPTTRRLVSQRACRVSGSPPATPCSRTRRCGSSWSSTGAGTARVTPPSASASRSSRSTTPASDRRGPPGSHACSTGPPHPTSGTGWSRPTPTRPCRRTGWHDWWPGGNGVPTPSPGPSSSTTGASSRRRPGSGSCGTSTLTEPASRTSTCTAPTWPSAQRPTGGSVASPNSRSPRTTRCGPRSAPPACAGSPQATSRSSPPRGARAERPAGSPICCDRSRRGR